MRKAEEYSFEHLGLKKVYLSTKGQEEFYRKLGYCECEPISIYGGAPVANNFSDRVGKRSVFNANTKCNVPKPPPLPKNVPVENCTKIKTYMFKTVNK